MKTICIVLIVLISGCAANQPINFSHPHGNQQQYLADAKQCEYEAIKHSQVADPRYGALYGQYDLVTRQRELSVMCMESRGYSVITKAQEADARNKR